MALKQNLISSAINKVKSFASGIGQNISNSVNDNQGWIQQGKFTPGKQIANQINYQKQVSPINRALYTGIETAGRPIVNSFANIGALGATALGSAQMTFNKPQAAEKSYKTAIDLRNFAGTQGSFDQGTGLQTLKKGGIDAIQTALTGKGLKYMTPANLGISSLLGGTMSKLSGGDFATGAGRAMGTLPSIMGAVGATNPLLAKLIPVKASGVASRLTGGLLNVAQGVGINASQGMPNTPASLGLDLVTGLAGGKTQFDAPNLKMGITDQSKGVIPEVGGKTKYQWFNNDESKFVPAQKAKSVPIEGLDTFVHQGRRGGGWQVSEAKSGAAMSDIFPTEKAAIADATSKLQAFKKSGLDVNAQIKKVSDYNLESINRQVNVDKNAPRIKQLEDTMKVFKNTGAADNNPEVYTKIYDEWKSLKYPQSPSIPEVKGIPIELQSLANKARQFPNEQSFIEWLRQPEQISHGTENLISTFSDRINGSNITRFGDSGNFYKQVIKSQISPEVKTNQIIKQSTEIPQGKIAIKGKTLPVEKVPEIVRPAQVDIQQNKVLKPNKLDSASESIIQQARKQIGKPTEVKKSLSQKFDQFYTDWVDRYNPLVKLTDKVKGIKPENDPKYVIRRFLGAGSIAEQRFNSEMKPILKSVDDLGIDKLDLDAYLINKRNVGFGEIGRVVKGSDPIQSQKVVSALEAKYGADISGIADKLYSFQNQGLDDMVKAGFISPEGASAMKGQNPDYAPFQRVMDELDDYLGLPTKKAMQGTQPIKKLKGSERQILSPVESIIANIFSQRAAIEKNNVAKSVAGLKDLMPNIGFKTVSKGGDSTITVWSGGKKVFIEVGSDISRAMKGMNEETAGSLMKILTAPASLLRQGATGRNPEFMLPNVVRDQLDAAVNSKYGYVPFVDYVRGLAHIVKKDEIFDKWMSSGGAQSFGSISGRKSISAMFDEKTAKKGLFSWLGKGLDLMGKYSEQPTRVGLFAKTLKKTGSEITAAYESREGTMDFARMGAKMKVANSIIPFLNVQVQGFDKMIRNFKDAPIQTAVKMGIYGITPAVLATLYNERYHSEEYAEIPQFVKDDNFILVKGRNDKGTVDYVTIPKGNLIRLVTNPAEHFVSYLAGNDKTTFGEMVTSLLSSNIPLLGEGASVGEVALKTVGQNIPQAIKPITENLVNKSFFKYDTKKEQSKNIVPDYLLSKPPSDQTYKFTPSMYQVIGKVLNASPLKVQNLMEGYLAGYTKIPANIIDSLKNISEGKDVEQNKVPILRRFLQETYPTTTTKPKVKAEATPLIPQAKAAEGGFLSKIFPKKAPETAETMTEIPYVNENGNDAKIILSKYDDIAKMPTSNKYEIALKEGKQFSSAATILDNQYLTAEQKQVVLKRLGIDQPTAAYYQVANDNTNLKTLWVMDKLEGATDKNSVIEGLSNLRKQVNGQMIASNAVLDNLVDEGVISKAEATQLKKYKFEEGKLTPIKKTGTKAKKPKKVSIKKAPKIKLAKSKKIKITTVKSKAYKPIRFKIPKKLKVKKIAIRKSV